MELRTIKICDIKVKDRMRLDKGDIEGLAESIKEKGLLQPITVNEDMKLLAGERRLLAFKLLGLQEIQAVVRHGIDTVDALEVELVENVFRKEMSWTEICNLQKRLFEEKSKKGKWSQQKQAEMLSSSQPQISRQINMARALELLPELAERNNFDEAWRELKALEEDVHVEILRQKAKPSAEHPQWAENYRVGDAIAGMTGIYGETCDFIEVDPPYPRDADAKHSLGDYNEIDESEYEAFYERVASEVYRILRPDSFGVFFYDWRFHSEVRDILQRAGFSVPTAPAIWTRGSSGHTNTANASSLTNHHEPFWIARKGEASFFQSGRGNVFDFNPVSPSAKIHPTERPIALIEEILRTCCKPGSVVMSPFLGSGVTIRAAYRHGCEAFGFDLSEMHRARFLKKVSEEK